MGNDVARVEGEDATVAECQTCGLWFDERAYQVIVWGLGSFDSVECAEKAARRARRSAGTDVFVQASSHQQPQTVPPTPTLAPENER
jgi:hypothetical protein